MKHPGIWLTAVVLALVVLLAQIAGASTRDEIASGATSASVTAGTIHLLRPAITHPYVLWVRCPGTARLGSRQGLYAG